MSTSLTCETCAYRAGWPGNNYCSEVSRGRAAIRLPSESADEGSQLATGPSYAAFKAFNETMKIGTCQATRHTITRTYSGKMEIIDLGNAYTTTSR